MLVLCRLVAAATTSPVPHPLSEKYAELALRRYDHVSDADLLVLYVPLLQTCVHLWWQRGRDSTLITERLKGLAMKGINTKGKTLTQALHALGNCHHNHNLNYFESLLIYFPLLLFFRSSRRNKLKIFYGNDSLRNTCFFPN